MMLVSVFGCEKRRSFSFEEKKKICLEAYGKEKNIKPTARKYDVQGNMIRSWNKRLMVSNEEEQQIKKKEEREVGERDYSRKKQ